MTTLATPRLHGRRLGPADYDRLAALFTDARVTATLAADGQPLPPQRIRDILAGFRAAADNRGHGLWLFFAGGAFVGYCGLRRKAVEGRDQDELLYALRPEYWGQGLGSEMAGAVLAHGAAHGLERIVAFTLPHNIGSRRVMEKNGLVFERMISHAGLPHVLYRRPYTERT